MDDFENIVTDAPEGTPQSDENGDVVNREQPNIPEERKKLVKKWQEQVRLDKKHWEASFKRIREDQEFAWGNQWSREEEDDRYQANITLRHIQQRVAALYAKNPKAIASRRERLMSTTWDGTMTQVMASMQKMQQFMLDPMAAQANPMAMQEPMTILQEADENTKYNDQMDKFGRTLELLYQYNIDEQTHPFKTMMKLVTRRSITTSVGYVKLGFQRVMEVRPEVEARIADASQRLSTLERISADLADGKIEDETAPEREQLRLLMADLQQEQEAVLREGLVFDFPDSCTIIPDRKTRQLREFLGADYVTQEYVLEPDEVQEIYGVDITAGRDGDGAGYREYRPGTTSDPNSSPINAVADNTNSDPSSSPYMTQGKAAGNSSMCLVWEIYSRKDGLVYVVCDGYKDFLREPKSPDVWTERFWPWFALVLNEADHPSKIYPPSDVRLISDQQREYNRLREGLREHRIANRPKTAVAGGMLSEDDVKKLSEHPANAVLEFDGLQPGQSIDQLLQPIRLPGVDPNLYEVNGIFEDILRTVGVQEANLGGAGGGTATETSIAESSRMSSLQSNIDDMDEMLTELAKAAGQILLAEVSAETVKEAIGPGAMWPELSREQLSKEVFLEIEAGSTGRPNQAQEIQNFERLAPILMQIPGINPEALAKEAIRRLDDKLELSDLYSKDQLSIVASNQLAGSAGGPQQNAGPNAPDQQGAQGGSNAPSPNGPAGATGGPDIPQGTAPVQ